jgi:hypothetical protein
MIFASYRRLSVMLATMLVDKNRAVAAKDEDKDEQELCGQTCVC